MVANDRSNKKLLKIDFWFWCKVIITIFIILFLLYPFSSLLYRSFFSKKVEGITLYNFIKFFSKKYYYCAFFNSMYVSIVSTAVCIIVGVPLAYIMTRYNVAGKKVLNILIIMSLMSPPFIGAYSWIILFGRSGFITKILESLLHFTMPTIYGKVGIITVFVLKLFPYIYLYTSGAMSSIDSNLEEAAENLGSSKLRRLMTITLPVVMPSIAAGAIMVFMSAIADFGTPMLIGESYSTLPVLIYNEYMSETGGNAYFASAVSVIVVFVSIVVLLIQKYWVSKKNYIMTSMRPPAVIKLKGMKRFLTSLPVYIVTFLASLPILVVTYTSLLATDGPVFQNYYRLDSYTSVGKRLITNIKNTFIYSGVAIIIIVILGMLLSYIIGRQKGKFASVMDAIIMFPYVIPGSVLGICLIVSFNKRPILLTGTAAIIIISFIVRKLSYTIRSGTAFLQQLDPSIEEASINLGVSPKNTFFKITARIMAPGIFSGAILSWIACINELSSSIMLYSGKTSTIAVAIYSSVVRNNYGVAAALATILTVSTAISLIVFLVVSKGKVSVV